MDKVGDLIAKTRISSDETVNGRETVNSSKGFNPTANSYTDESSKSQVDELLETLQGKPDFVASELAAKLSDNASVPYYRILAKEIPVQVLMEALASTLDADRDGKIRTKKAIYFLGILRMRNYPTKFQGA